MKYMKKMIYIILFLMLMPMVVLADSAGPILGYDAVITNKNGAKCIDEDKIIAFNKKVHVSNEYDGNADIGTCLISINDILPSKNELIPTNKDLNKGDFYNATMKKINEKIIVLEKNGVRLSKGPAASYQQYDYVIPLNQELKVTYALESYKRGYGPYIWYYVDDGDYRGWIDSSFEGKYKFAFYYESEVLILANTNVFDENDNAIFYIPAETKVTDLYKINNDSNYYVYYNDKRGYIDGNHFYFCNTFDDVNEVAIDDIELKSSTGNTKEIIKMGQKINRMCYFVDHQYDGGPPDFYYVESADVKGIITQEEYRKVISIDNTIKKLEYDINIYDIKLLHELLNNEEAKVIDLKEKYKKNNIIKANTDFKVIGTYYNWNNNIRTQFDIIEDNGDFAVILEESNENKQQENNNDDKSNDSKKEIILPENTKKKSNSSNTIIFAVAGAVILAIVSFVTIKIINRNKKVKNQEEKTIEVNKEKDVKEIVKEENVVKKREVTIKKEEGKE